MCLCTCVCICICHYELTYCLLIHSLFVLQNVQYHPQQWYVTSYSCHVGIGPWRTKGSYFCSSVYLGKHTSVWNLFSHPPVLSLHSSFTPCQGKLLSLVGSPPLGVVQSPTNPFTSLFLSALKMEWKYLDYNAKVTGCHCTPASSTGLPHGSSSQMSCDYL